MKKLQNFFTNSFYLKKLTRGSKYFSIQDFDIALTEAQNVFIKVPSTVDSCAAIWNNLRLSTLVFIQKFLWMY